MCLCPVVLPRCVLQHTPTQFHLPCQVTAAQPDTAHLLGWPGWAGTRADLFNYNKTNNLLSRKIFKRVIRDIYWTIYLMMCGGVRSKIGHPPFLGPISANIKEGQA